MAHGKVARASAREEHKARRVAFFKRRMGEEYARVFGGITSGVLIDYQRIPAKDVHALRETLRAKNLRMEVVRNRIARRTLEEAGTQGSAGLFRGPVAVVYGVEGADEVTAPRVVVECVRKEKRLEIRGGILDGRALSVREVQSLSRLPTRSEMFSQVLATLLAPAVQVANLFQNTLATFANQVSNHIEKLERAAPGASQPAGSTANTEV
ncbi:MAG: 50S ribosomal protein L10 [Planctomycetes bacterium]|nr:50S ribosomal protein L10 [Planctomycetota bacterium]